MMLQQEKTKQVLQMLDDLCGKCNFCSSQCQVAIAKRAMQSLLYELQKAGQK